MKKILFISILFAALTAWQVDFAQAALLDPDLFLPHYNQIFYAADDRNIRFLWSDVGASSYELIIGLDGSAVVDITLTGTFFVVDAYNNLSQDKTYQWSVTACDDNGGCSFSSVGFFEYKSGSAPSSGGTSGTDNAPSGTLSVSKTTAKVGENITITVTGTDDKDVITVGAQLSDGWREKLCDGAQEKTSCTKTWTITENKAGEYTYYGLVGDGVNAKVLTEPKTGIKVTFTAASALSVQFSANPSSGKKPLATVFTATVSGGNPQDTINYSVWWDCSDPTKSTDVSFLNRTCGDPSNSATGEKRNGQDYTTGQFIHTYDFCEKTSCTYTAKLIVERGNSAVESQIPVTISSESGIISIKPLSPITALVGSQQTFTAEISTDQPSPITSCKFYQGPGVGTPTEMTLSPSPCLKTDQNCSATVKSIFTKEGVYQSTVQCSSQQGSVDSFTFITVSKPGTPGDGTPPGDGDKNKNGDTGGTVSFGGTFKLENPLKVESFEELLNAIISFVFWVGLAVAPVMLIIAGFMFVISAGSQDKLKTAKNIALYTFIGLAVLLLAKGLVTVLLSILGGK